MKIILFIFLFSLSLISSGCYTYYPTRENPDPLKVEKDEYVKIQKFYLYNGDSIDVSEYDVKYFDNYKNYKNVFVCTQLDYILNKQAYDLLKIKTEEKIIPSENVKSVTTEKRIFNTTKTVLFVSSITILTMSAIILILSAAVASSFSFSFH